MYRATKPFATELNIKPPHPPHPPLVIMVGRGRVVGRVVRSVQGLLYGDVLLGKVDGPVMYGREGGRDLGE